MHEASGSNYAYFLLLKFSINIKFSQISTNVGISLKFCYRLKERVKFKKEQKRGRQADRQTGRQAHRQQMDWFRVPSKFRCYYLRECLWADCVFGSVSAPNIKYSSVSGSV
jgi:hypothetical protein